MTDFAYSPMFPLAEDETEYELVTTEGVEVIELDGEAFLKVAPEALTPRWQPAPLQTSHIFCAAVILGSLPGSLMIPKPHRTTALLRWKCSRTLLWQPMALLPMCQDTGTAIISGTRGDKVLVTGNDAEALSRGVYDTYQTSNLRYSQLAATDMFTEVNTATNLPAQIDLYAGKGMEYKFAFIQKGGGSANKTFLHQKTKAVLNPESLREFIRSAILDLGTSACPPYHLAVVVGGTSAETTLKTVKQASIRALDGLPTKGNTLGHAWRDTEWEAEILQITRDLRHWRSVWWKILLS